MTRTGPLEGIRVVAFEAIGPVPFATNHLADLGAEVTTITRPRRSGNRLPEAFDPTTAGVGTLVDLDCKTDAGRQAALSILETADVLIEGLRPGAMERLGLGPDAVLERNPALVYARVTGWGQQGPYSGMAGHDINYIGLTGVLHAIGPAEQPIPPLNLVGDYGGGAMYAVSGILAALVRSRSSGQGSVIDVAMVDGASALLGPMRAMYDNGTWADRRAANLLDGGAPFYCTYRTSEGRFVAVGALEPDFYDALVAGLGLDATGLPDRHDIHRWPELRSRFEERFAERTRDEWADTFDGTDACVTPVLSMAEVMEHKHNRVRGLLEPSEGASVPAPAPRIAMR